MSYQSDDVEYNRDISGLINQYELPIQFKK